jgi:hypothetical protein
MILKKQFGRTGHNSIRIIFDSYALSNATQAETNQILELSLSWKSLIIIN